MKKLISLFLSIIMVICAVSATGIYAFAEDEDYAEAEYAYAEEEMSDEEIYGEKYMKEMKKLKGVEYHPAAPITVPVDNDYYFWYIYQEGDELVEIYKSGKKITYTFSEKNGFVDSKGNEPKFREYQLDDAAMYLNLSPLYDFDENYNKVGKHNYILNYAGFEVKIPCKVVPASTKITKLTKKSKGFTVKWKKQTKQTSGYQVQYAANSKFTKNKKTVTVSGKSKTSKTISKLKGGKKYYVRVRTYKTVDGKKYYSEWSKASKVTTKK